MAALLLTPSAHPAAARDGVAGGWAASGEPDPVLLPRLVRALARQAAAEARARAGIPHAASEPER
jgi:hypothetical protein